MSFVKRTKVYIMPCFEKIHPLFSLLKTQHNTTNISYGQFITYENRDDAVLRPAQSVRQRRPLPPAPKNISSPQTHSAWPSC